MAAPDHMDTSEALARHLLTHRERLVELRFLEQMLVRLPEKEDIIEALGHLYTEAGRYEDGLRMDRRMVEMMPESELAWYNLGCSLALTQQPDAAMMALQTAVDLGYDDAEWMTKDDDLVSLRNDPRFVRLVRAVRSIGKS